MENMVTLYIGTHNTTGLKYFGKSELLFTQEDLQKFYHGSGTYWKRHIKKHGDDVTMEIYGIFHIDEVKEIALKFSKDNNIVESKEWANLVFETGKTSGTPGYIVSEETKKKISNTRKERKIESWNKGLILGERYCNPMKESTKEKISKANKGKVRTEDMKLKISIANKGRNLSEETKMKISESLKGRQSSLKGTKRSEEAKKKTSETLKKTLSNEKNRDKMSERQQGSKNSSAKRIQLFNEKDELIIDIIGGFRKYLNQNNMPLSIENTYRNDSIISRGVYKGWYARELSKKII